MAISTCVVSGTLVTPSNTALSGVEVKAYSTKPLFHTDGTLIVDYAVSTTTDSNGDWSLTLIETETIEASLTVSFDMPVGAVERKRKDYTVVVPNAASADFADIVTE